MGHSMRLRNTVNLIFNRNKNLTNINQFKMTTYLPLGTLPKWLIMQNFIWNMKTHLYIQRHCYNKVSH